MSEPLHFLTGEELSIGGLAAIIDRAEALRLERNAGKLRKDLEGKTVVMLFDKQSLRTRVSFSVAVNELGGFAIESIGSSRKHEEPEDVAGVMNGFCHAVVVRTHADSIVERMARASRVPVINALTDDHHPCQVMADLLTLKQLKGRLKGLKFAYIGDGNNMLHSMALLMPALGVHVHYACPEGYQPKPGIMLRAQKRAVEGGGSITAFKTPKEAVAGVDAIYTDVWTSMGFEAEEKTREEAFTGYQLNAELYSLAARDALIMHCMPMIRGKEITSEMADHACSAIFRQSENRLHVQKALLLDVMGRLVGSAPGR